MADPPPKESYRLPIKSIAPDSDLKQARGPNSSRWNNEKKCIDISEVFCAVFNTDKGKAIPVTGREGT
jgi:hypothetical protein